MSLSRRNLIMGGVAAAISCSLPQVASASKLDDLKAVIDPTLRLYNANTDERIFVTFHNGSSYDEQALRRLDWFMRDWREGLVKNIDRDLLWSLAAIGGAAKRDGHSGEIHFLSGFRSRKTNEMLRRKSGGVARNSMHIKARAVDFRLPGVGIQPIYKYARWLNVGGVGLYTRSNFVHMDTGDVRSWGS